jgi:hypothetical protein
MSCRFRGDNLAVKGGPNPGPRQSVSGENLAETVDDPKLQNNDMGSAIEKRGGK